MIRSIIFLQEYSGNWTCQLESYHVSHENQKGFGKKVNGSIYVNVISNVLDPETQNRNAVIIGLLLVGSLIVGVLLMFLGRKKDLDLRIYKSQWSWSRLPSQSTDDLVDPMCERVNQNPDFLWNLNYGFLAFFDYWANSIKLLLNYWLCHLMSLMISE